MMITMSEFCSVPATRLVLANEFHVCLVEEKEPVVSSAMQLDTQLLEELGIVRPVELCAESGNWTSHQCDAPTLQVYQIWDTEVC